MDPDLGVLTIDMSSISLGQAHSFGIQDINCFISIFRQRLNPFMFIHQDLLKIFLVDLPRKNVFA